ncbi:MAG: AAA family ATPase [Candidatus Nanopelagicales bacterium]
MTRMIAIANQKGGVAKTTTVASIAAALAEFGQRVLAVDLDPQACLTFSLGLDPESLETSMHDVLLGRVEARRAVVVTDEGIHVLPATIDLAGTEAQLLTRTGREFALRTALADVADDYDVILLDCSPSLGVLTINALTAAGEVLIPLQCETLSHRGVGQLLDTIADVRRITNRDLVVLGVLPTLFDSRTNHSRAVLADIQDRYDLAILGPSIPRSIRFAEAPAVGRTALAGGRFRGAEAYRQLARGLLDGTAAGYEPDVVVVPAPGGQPAEERQPATIGALS